MDFLNNAKSNLLGILSLINPATQPKACKSAWICLFVCVSPLCVYCSVCVCLCVRQVCEQFTHRSCFHIQGLKTALSSLHLSFLSSHAVPLTHTPLWNTSPSHGTLSASPPQRCYWLWTTHTPPNTQTTSTCSLVLN